MSMKDEHDKHLSGGRSFSLETSASKYSRLFARRTFLGGALAALVAACSSSPTGQSSATTPPPKASSTQTIRVPRAPISPSNAAQMQRLALFQVDAGRVRGLAWAPDGKTLAVGTQGAVFLWDVLAGKQLARLADMNSSTQVYQLSWSLDGRSLAAGNDENTLLIWDMQSRSLQKTLQGTASVILSVAWSPEGDRLAAGNSDGTVQIWERATWRALHTWNDPATPGPFRRGRLPVAAYMVAWAPGGEKLAATRYDGYVRVWDSHSGKLLHVLRTSDQPNGVSWSPDGQTLASASDDGTIQLWNASTYKQRSALDGEPQGGWAFAIPWSPDGRLLACSRNGSIVLIWDGQTGKELNALHEQTQSIWTAAWSPDSQRLAAGCDDGTVCLWGVL